MSAHDIGKHPLHLGLGATAQVEPPFDGALDWYADYSQRHAADGAEGRLVTLHTFHAPWTMWEMHPNGSEVVLCTAGEITLHQQQQPGGPVSTVHLRAGQYAINDPGVWHTADVHTEATALFITAGMDTQHRAR